MFCGFAMFYDVFEEGFDAWDTWDTRFFAAARSITMTFDWRKTTWLWLSMYQAAIIPSIASPQATDGPGWNQRWNQLFKAIHVPIYEKRQQVNWLSLLGYHLKSSIYLYIYICVVIFRLYGLICFPFGMYLYHPWLICSPRISRHVILSTPMNSSYWMCIARRKWLLTLLSSNQL